MPEMPPVHRPTGARTKAEADRDYKRAHKDDPDRRFLRTAAWRSVLRPQQLAREPFCQQCEREGRRYVVATEVDHIIPPRGDVTLQRSESNYQSMCKSCHSTKTRLQP